MLSAHPAVNCMVQVDSPDSVEHFLLTFSGDQLLKGLEDLVRWGHHPNFMGTNSTGPPLLTGTVQTGGSSGAVSEVVTLSALQTVSVNGSAVQATIPLVQQSVATANVTSISGSCQTGFDCVDFTLAVPGVNAFVGTFSGSGSQYTQGNGAVTYQVDGQPVNHADGTPVCGQSDAVSSSVIVTPGNSFSTGLLSFTNCS